MAREHWFRQRTKMLPWAVYPIHWKGWLLQIAGPATLVLFGNFAPLPSAIVAAVFVVGGIGFMIAVYTHTDAP